MSHKTNPSKSGQSRFEFSHITEAQLHRMSNFVRAEILQAAVDASELHIETLMALSDMLRLHPDELGVSDARRATIRLRTAADAFELQCGA